MKSAVALNPQSDSIRRSALPEHAALLAVVFPYGALPLAQCEQALHDLPIAGLPHTLRVSQGSTFRSNGCSTLPGLPSRTICCRTQST